MLQIPLRNVPRQSLKVTLDGQIVIFTVWWQPFDKHWYATIETFYVVLARSRRLQANIDLLSGISVTFDGVLSVLQQGEVEQIPGPSENPWGRTHSLVWEALR